MRRGTHRSLAPRIVAESWFDSSLTDLSRCETYREAERAQFPVPNNFIWGARDLGDHSFRMFRVVPADHGQSLDIVYAEFDEKRLGTNTYRDAFSIVNLSGCETLDSVPVMRPRKKDESTGATRNYIRGLFQLDERTFLIANSEQAGHLADPASYRALDAWAIRSEGKFQHICSWIPKAAADHLYSKQVK
jgi:hypothetical protein